MHLLDYDCHAKETLENFITIDKYVSRHNLEKMAYTAENHPEANLHDSHITAPTRTVSFVITLMTNLKIAVADALTLN